MSPLPDPGGGAREFFTYNAVGHTVSLSDGDAARTKLDLYGAYGGGVTTSGTSPNNRLANTKERTASNHWKCPPGDGVQLLFNLAGDGVTSFDFAN